MSTTNVSYSDSSVNITNKQVALDIPTSDPPFKPEQNEQLYVLGIPMHRLPKLMQFAVSVLGVFGFYLIYGYMQELIFQLEGFKTYGWYLTLIQFACYTIFGTTEMQFKADKRRRIPMSNYWLLALLTVGTMGLSNAAVGYLNYPTQVIFKCCKLLPVMIGGVLIQGKSYYCIDVVAALFMSVGLVLFTLADVQIQPNFDHLGVLMIGLALCADAAIGNVQEKAIREHRATNTEVVLYSYSIGFLYILVGLTLHGSLFSAFAFCYQYPIYTYGYAFIFSLSGYLGITFVLTLVRTFGALLAVTVTTCRKAVTIVLSFLFFAKPFTMQYLWSGLVVLFGIFLNVYSKNQNKMDQMISDFVRKLAISYHKPRVLSSTSQTV